MFGVNVVLILHEPVATVAKRKVRARQWRDVVFECRGVGVERLIEREGAEAKGGRRRTPAATTPAATTSTAGEGDVANEAAERLGIALHSEARGQEAPRLEIVGDEGACAADQRFGDLVEGLDRRVDHRVELRVVEAVVDLVELIDVEREARAPRALGVIAEVNLARRAGDAVEAFELLLLQ